MTGECAGVMLVSVYAFRVDCATSNRADHSCSLGIARDRRSCAYSMMYSEGVILLARGLCPVAHVGDPVMNFARGP